MNKRSKRGMQAKKILCLIMAVLLILPTIAQAGMINVRAEEIETESMGEENIRTYEGTGYKITYVVTGSWENHQSIEITLENTGTENINDWSITMDTTGTLTGLWNATWQVVNEEQTVIKCQTYNSTILPGSSITFGYTLEGENIKNPENIQLTGIAQEINDGYRVEYRTTGEWEGGFQAEITIINESTQPLEGWSLILTGNFTMKSWWNGEVTQNEDGSYTVTHTAWDNSIPVGESRTIGFVGTKSEEELRIDSTKLTVTTWGKATTGEEESKPGEPETQPAEPESNPTEPETKPTEPETNPIVPDEEINWNDETDTDEDGIPDVYEIHMFRTNQESADTDGDKLSDGYEILNLGTNPTTADSDENGITDAKEDADEDGIDNLSEYELGTNPLSKDSDYDGLTDNDELQTYATDPKNNDTDSDGICDGDEIKLGLSPLNPATNGVPDNQYTVSQSINETSPVLEEINASINNPYKISLDIKASGVAENSITVQGTTENEMFQNEAYIGELISIDYTDTLKVENLRLNFHMDETVLENELDLFGDETTELKGIRRFNVFKFVEGANMLLPIETHHDTEQNIVYAETDEDGIYYLVDMEKWLYGLWTLNIDEQPATYMMERDVESTTEEINVQNESTKASSKDLYILTELAGMEEITPFLSISTRVEEKDDTPIDIVFITQSEGLWNDGFYGAGDLISGVVLRIIQRKYSNVRVCVLNRTESTSYFLGGNLGLPQWFTTEEELHSYKPEEYEAEETYIVRNYFDMLCNQEIMGYREDAAKFVLDIQLGYNEVGYYYFQRSMEKMKNMGINFSEFQDIDQCYGVYTDTFKSAIESTGGIIFSFESSESGGTDDFPTHVDEVMSTWAPPQKEFPAVVATGYRTIFLQNTLSSTNGTDSDWDTLTDWQEVNTKLLSWDGKGNIVLPTLKWCIENASEESYVVAGLERFKEDKTPAGVPSNIYDEYMDGILESVRILPIDSDPVSVDGDGDGFPDKYSEKTVPEEYYQYDDPNPLISDVQEISLKNDFFSVDYEKKEMAEDDWVDINNGRIESYGGYQGWLGKYGYTKDDKIFCDGTIEGWEMHDSGCGIIAVADFFMYMALGDSRYNIAFRPNDVAVLNLGEQYVHIDFEFYVSYVTEISNNFKIILNGVPAIGLDEYSVLNGMKKISELNNMGLSFEWATTTIDSMCKLLMIGMIKDDIPVVFSYYTFFADTQGKKLYQMVKHEYVYSNIKVTRHYMVGTGLITYSDEVADLVGHKTMIKVGTYGKTFYIDFEDYCKDLNLTTNIFTIHR